MSDVFDLPLEVSGQAICDQGCGDVLTANFSNTKADPILDYTAIAINAYDANQESISSLLGSVHNLATDGLKQQERIAELEAFIRRYRYRVEMRGVETTGFIDNLLVDNNETT